MVFESDRLGYGLDRTKLKVELEFFNRRDPAAEPS